jgi:hypothetical protein
MVPVSAEEFTYRNPATASIIRIIAIKEKELFFDVILLHSR